MKRNGMEAVLKHMAGTRDPLAEVHPWYVIIELSSQMRSGLREQMEGILSEGLERGLVTDAAIAESGEQTKAFWRVREVFGEAQRHEGGAVPHDVSVPVASVPAFITATDAAVTALIPGSRPVSFGHLGDGNVHYSVVQPVGADRDKFIARREEISAAVFDVVGKFNGSISAEHGIGAMKRDILLKVKDPVALDLMRALKRTLDPNNILNPGKVL
jgi:FAD/FMN-containing dehydrogenase